MMSLTSLHDYLIREKSSVTNNILIIAASSSVAGRFPAVLVYK